MKKTPLYNEHLKLVAKIVPFAGFEMPVHYEGVTKEHLSVRNEFGVFDVSHMGEFKISGLDALAFLQRVCSNDIAKLKPGKAQYNFFPNESGGVVDDLIVYQLSPNYYMLVVNAANIDKDWKWLEQQKKGFNVQLEDLSDETILLAVQGPKAIESLQSLTDLSLKEIAYYSHQEGTFADCEYVTIANTGYTGSGGVELYFDKKYASIIWNEILPNVRDAIMVEGAMRWSWMLLGFSSLSFLGFGVSPPTPDWGLMISNARGLMSFAYWAVLAPIFGLSSLIIGINLTADAFAKALGIDRSTKAPV